MALICYGYYWLVKKNKMEKKKNNKKKFTIIKWIVINLRNSFLFSFVSKVHIFLNNQTDALIIPILFCYKTLHVSGIFYVHHQELSTVHSALVSFMQVSDDRFQAESGWNCSSILTLLGNGHQKPA